MVHKRPEVLIDVPWWIVCPYSTKESQILVWLYNHVKNYLSKNS